MSVETAGEKPGLKKRNRRDHYVPQSYLRGFIDPLRLNSHQPPWHFDVHQNVWSERGTREIRYRIRATYICLWAATSASHHPHRIRYLRAAEERGFLGNPPPQLRSGHQQVPTSEIPVLADQWFRSIPTTLYPLS